MPNEPSRGAFRAVQFIGLLSARERDDAVGQRQAQMLGSSGSGGKWGLCHSYHGISCILP